MTSASSVVEAGRMGFAQWAAIMVLVSINGVDGIDILAISFAAPGIAAEWNIDQSLLGWLLSMELAGMGVGSILLGNVADRFGRRSTILGSLCVMAAGMLFSSHSASIGQLMITRVLTGIGIGGMLPAITAAAAELSNVRYRHLAMSLMVIGYPLAGAGAGTVIQGILATNTGWRAIFQIGAASTLACLVLAYFLVPETPAHLERSRRRDSLQRTNAALKLLGHKAIASLPDATPDLATPGFGELFGRRRLATTSLVTAAYFAHMITWYFILKWTPKVVVDFGFTPGEAAGVLARLSLAGALGGVALGILATRLPLRALMVCALAAEGAAVAWFALGARDLHSLQWQTFAAGFFGNAAVAGLYMLVAGAFPPILRGNGSGFVFGVGRGAAMLAPILAGTLMQAGMTLSTVASLMGIGSLIAALAVIGLRAGCSRE